MNFGQAVEILKRGVVPWLASQTDILAEDWFETFQDTR